MEVRLTVAGDDVGERLRSLSGWLADVAELRGRVQPVEAPPPPRSLGPVLEALAVVLAPGGVAAAFVPALVAWIRAQSGEVTVRVTRPDGSSVEITASGVRHLDTPALRNQVDDVLRSLEDDGEGDDHGTDGVVAS